MMIKTRTRVRCRLAGEVVEGIAWDDGRAPGMLMFHRDGFDDAHPISIGSVIGVESGAPTKEQCRLWSALIDSFGTRRALAIQLGVSESTVWRWMHRHHPSDLTQSAVNALCKDRNVTPIYR
jgi:hypothetical protein